MTENNMHNCGFIVDSVRLRNCLTPSKAEL